MFAFTMTYPSGKVQLVGFVNSQKEADDLLDKICSRYGTEYIASSGIRFGLELAA